MEFWGYKTTCTYGPCVKERQSTLASYSLFLPPFYNAECRTNTALAVILEGISGNFRKLASFHFLSGIQTEQHDGYSQQLDVVTATWLKSQFKSYCYVCGLAEKGENNYLF